jgi:endonuclease/exonuclease/phosphatase family metal-dependent hydrolase
MVVGVWHNVVARLTPVLQAERQGFLALPPTREAHAGAHASVAAFREIELQQAATPRASAQTIRIAAWNLERCLYPDEAARILARNHVDIALLTEMDVGVFRTGQVHTIGRIAASLGQGYCYGCEFLELVPMEPPGSFPRVGSGNSEGYHGNGIVSALRMHDPIVIRLDEMADWYTPADRQRRIGNRMAIATGLEVSGNRFVACSVHLENRTDGDGRAKQMVTLLDALDRYAGSAPVVIGGDLNTHVGAGGYIDTAEPLFALAASRGYGHRATWQSQPRVAAPGARAKARVNSTGSALEACVLVILRWYRRSVRMPVC